jgi:hypothetical protein
MLIAISGTAGAPGSPAGQPRWGGSLARKVGKHDLFSNTSLMRYVAGEGARGPTKRVMRFRGIPYLTSLTLS